MRLSILFLPLLFLSQSCLPQKSIEAALSKYNTNSVEYTFVEDLKKDEAVLFDTRKFEEYEVSHIENATWVGYKKFDIESIEERFPDKATPIVVYCSIGVRSEDIGEKLLEAGYTEVKNLYGGIFEWTNAGNSLIDSVGTTKKIHGYNKQWSKLLRQGQIVY